MLPTAIPANPNWVPSDVPVLGVEAPDILGFQAGSFVSR